jgi:hypothetical protein
MPGPGYPSLALAVTHSGLVVTGIMLSRAIPAITVGPLAGVLLDRFDRKRIMIASDLTRAVVALGFILAVGRPRIWLLYLFSALLMAASPFFTAGRSAILPTIANEDEIYTANSLTQITHVDSSLIRISKASLFQPWVDLADVAFYSPEAAYPSMLQEFFNIDGRARDVSNLMLSGHLTEGDA